MPDIYTKESSSRVGTQKICDDYEVIWKIRLRQLDINNFFSHQYSYAARSSNGICQVLPVIFMHIRGLLKGNPQGAAKLFKYWCFKNKFNQFSEKIQNRESGKEIIKTLNENDINFIETFINDTGTFNLFKTVNDYWDNIKFRVNSAKNTGLIEYSKQGCIENNNSIFSIKEDKGFYPDISSTCDIDYIRKYNPNYLESRTITYKETNIKGISEAITHEIYNKVGNESEIYMYVSLTSSDPKYAEKSHALYFARMSDNSNYIELVDSNRGVFWIPYNPSKDNLKKFLNQILSALYAPFHFSNVQIEHFEKCEKTNENDSRYLNFNLRETEFKRLTSR